MQTLQLTLNGATSQWIEPQTNNYQSNVPGYSNEDYIFTILNANLQNGFDTGGTADTVEGVYQGEDLSAVLNEFTTIENAFSVRGKKLQMTPTTNAAEFGDNITTRSTSIVVEGVQSGAIVSIPVIISKT